MKKRILYVLLIAIIGCSGEANSPFINIDAVSDEAEQYFNSALDTMKQYSINKYTLDWDRLSEEAFENTIYAQEPSDTYDAIRYVLQNSDEVPGFLVEPEYAPSFLKPVYQQIVTPAVPSKIETSIFGVRITDEIGYIRIPYFDDSNQAVENYPIVIRDLIKTVDAESVKGWIVDLRNCLSGNLWEMIAGVSPILGEGLAGKLIDADNFSYNWYVENGAILVNDIKAFDYDGPYQLFNLNPYVAVLTDSLTAASGEAVAISFKGRPDSRSFGNSTFGFSVLRSEFVLSDGARIYFTTYEMTDRLGNRYGYKVAPDVKIIADMKEIPTNNDAVVDTAVEWLNTNLQ